VLLALAWISLAAVSELPAGPAADPPLLSAPDTSPVRAAPPRLGLAVSAAALATLASTAASIGAGWILPAACFGAFGRPDPWCSAGGFALGTGVQLGLSLLVPEVYWLAGGATREAIASARLGLWQHARWAALAAAVFVVLYGIGAGLEHVDYGKGQPLLIVGGVGLAATALSFDVLAVIGATRGFLEAVR
jgi:hypothetical protein